MINADKIIRTKRKTIALSIDKDGRVIVRAPLKCSDKRIEDVLSDSEEWLKKQLKKFEENRRLTDRYSIENGGRMPLLGEDFEIRIEKTKKTFIDGRTITLPDNDSVGHLKKQYRKIAKSYFAERTEYFSSLMGSVPSSVKITSAKTRWGSCSAEKNINYSLSLVMCPLEIIDYVIVHELCHIKYMNHSSLFWNEVGKYIPDYKQRRRWLKENRYIMNLI